MTVPKRSVSPRKRIELRSAAGRSRESLHENGPNRGSLAGEHGPSGRAIAVQASHASGSVRPAAGSAAEQLRLRARRLHTLANELLVMANELDGEVSSPAALSEDQARWPETARRMYRNRRLRGQVFGDDALFGEPAWDLLLDLYIAAHDRKPVPVTSACIGAAVPTTTALRWIAVLEERGLLERQADAHDARRIFVALSELGRGKMAEYFARANQRERAAPLADEEQRRRAAG